MAMEQQDQHGIGAHDPLGLLARSARRSPLQELCDYPFFAPEGDSPARTQTIPHGGAWLAALLLALILEAVVLSLLLR